jgi:O-antigen ligase
MPFTYLFAIGYYIFILNLEKAFGFEQAVLVSKSIMMAAAFLAVLSRPIRHEVFLLACCILAIAVMSGVFTEFADFQWGIWLRAMNQLVVPLFMLSVTPTEKDRRTLLKALAFAPLFSLVVGALYQAIGKGTLFGMDNVSHVWRLQGSLIPAFLAGICLSAAVAAMILSQHVSKKYLYLCLFNCLALLLTAARMPLAVFLLLGGYYFFMELKLGVARKWAATALCAGLGGIFFLTAGQAILQRLGSSSTSGRDVIWNYYKVVSDTYPSFGVGLGHSALVIPHQISIQVGGVVAAHNEYLRLSTELGVIPAYLVLIAFLFIIGALWLRERKNLMILMAALGFLLFCYTDNAVVTPTNYPLLFAVIYGVGMRQTSRKPTPSAGAQGRLPPRRQIGPAIAGPPPEATNA